MPGPTPLQPTRSCCRCFSPPLAVRHCRGIGSASPNRFISPHVQAMPSTSPRSPTPLALRRPSHGQTVAFARPPDASCWPTLSNGVHNPSVLNEETGEAIVLVKPEGSCLMHRGDRFSHTGTVTLTNRNVVRKSARLIVLVNPVRGFVRRLTPANRRGVLRTTVHRRPAHEH